MMLIDERLIRSNITIINNPVKPGTGSARWLAGGARRPSLWWSAIVVVVVVRLIWSESERNELTTCVGDVSVVVVVAARRFCEQNGRLNLCSSVGHRKRRSSGACVRAHLPLRTRNRVQVCCPTGRRGWQRGGGGGVQLLRVMQQFAGLVARDDLLIGKPTHR